MFLAESVLPDGLPPGIEHHLRFVTYFGPEIARAEFKTWKRFAIDQGEVNCPTWKILMSNRAFVDLANALVDNFPLLLAVRPAISERRLFKFSYEEPFNDEKDLSPREKTAIRFGWKRAPVSVEVPSSSFANSYHLEIAAPRDLEIDVAQLRFRPSNSKQTNQAPADLTTGGGQRSHLYAASVGPEFQASAVAFLRRPRDFFLKASFATGFFVTILLGFGMARLGSLLNPEKPDHSQTAAALLLVIPTFLAAYIARPGEHRLASRVLVGVRALVIGSGLCAVVGVGVLASGYRYSEAIWIWRTALAVSILISMGLLCSLLLPRPTHQE